MNLATVELRLGDHDLNVYVASSPPQWNQGLVGQSLTDVDGMLFCFPTDVQWPFHMTGMTTPILVTYFTAAGQLTELVYLAVGATPHTPAGPYRYVLELVGDYATADGAIKLLPHCLDGLTVPVR